jgi:nucleoside-diphosphate-sugar epimerase
VRIALTGSSSAIGRRLTELLESQGMSVIPFGGRDSKIWKLGESFPDGVTADVLIHLAHDRNLSFKQNMDATNSLLDSFSGYKIFLSSLSCHSRTRSIYGLSKKFAEDRFLEKGGICVRAGVVYGAQAEGIFKVLENFILRNLVIPLPYSGKSRLFTTHIDDLCLSIVDLVQSHDSGLYFGACSVSYSLEEIVKKIAIGKQKRIFVLKINKAFTKVVIWLSLILKFHRVHMDSIKSLESQITDDELQDLRTTQNKYRHFQP